MDLSLPTSLPTSLPISSPISDLRNSTEQVKQVEQAEVGPERNAGNDLEFQPFYLTSKTVSSIEGKSSIRLSSI